MGKEEKERRVYTEEFKKQAAAYHGGSIAYPLSEEARQTKASMSANRLENLHHALTVPLDIQRAEWEQAALNEVLPEPIKTEDIFFGEISGERITGPDFREDRVILYFHGGGLISGSSVTHRKLCAHIAAKTGFPVIIHNYPLAPEHPFPAALDASIAVYRQLLAGGYRAQDIIFGSDSSGGALACAVILRLKQELRLKPEDAELPGAAFFFSPMLDYTLSGDSLKCLEELDNRIFQEDLSVTASLYCGGEPPSNPLISPLGGDFTGFPPVLIQTGSDEILLSDSLRLAEKLDSSRVPVELFVWEGMWHVFQAEAGNLPEADEALCGLSRFLGGIFPEQS